MSSAGSPGYWMCANLVAAFVHHLGVGDHEAVLHGVLVEFGSRIGVRHGNLDGFDVEFLGEGDGVA